MSAQDDYEKALAALVKIARGKPNCHPLTRHDAREVARRALAELGKEWKA